jgi:hypothetical protein
MHKPGMIKMKRLIVTVVISAVIAVMALRGCPRIRRNFGVSHKSLTAGATLLPEVFRIRLRYDALDHKWKLTATKAVIKNLNYSLPIDRGLCR